MEHIHSAIFGSVSNKLVTKLSISCKHWIFHGRLLARRMVSLNWTNIVGWAGKTRSSFACLPMPSFLVSAVIRQRYELSCSVGEKKIHLRSRGIFLPKENNLEANSLFQTMHARYNHHSIIVPRACLTWIETRKHNIIWKWRIWYLIRGASPSAEHM